MPVNITEATIEDIREAARDIRQAEADEIYAFCGGTPLAALAVSFKVSSARYAARHKDGTLLCVFGMKRDSWNSWEIWLITTKAVETIQYGLAFQREFQRVFKQYLTEFPYMHNWVHDKNTVSIKWLKRTGCKFGEGIIVNGERFFPFYIRGDSPCA